jgi:hypothetical protein
MDAASRSDGFTRSTSVSAFPRVEFEKQRQMEAVTTGGSARETETKDGVADLCDVSWE